MGIRIDNNFPGKTKAITNEPSDVVVHCVLLGSHSDNHGPMTTIANVGDFYIQFLTMFSSLSRIGLLEPTFKKVLNLLSHIDEFAIDDIEMAMYHYRKGPANHDVMIIVKCSCEELLRFYQQDHLFKETELKLIDAHNRLGHTVIKEYLTFNGKSWEVSRMEYLSKATDLTDYWSEPYVRKRTG